MEQSIPNNPYRFHLKFGLLSVARAACKDLVPAPGQDHGANEQLRGVEELLHERFKDFQSQLIKVRMKCGDIDWLDIRDWLLYNRPPWVRPQFPGGPMSAGSSPTTTRRSTTSAH